MSLQASLPGLRAPALLGSWPPPSCLCSCLHGHVPCVVSASQISLGPLPVELGPRMKVPQGPSLNDTCEDPFPEYTHSRLLGARVGHVLWGPPFTWLHLRTHSQTAQSPGRAGQAVHPIQPQAGWEGTPPRGSAPQAVRLHTRRTCRLCSEQLRYCPPGPWPTDAPEPRPGGVRLTPRWGILAAPRGWPVLSAEILPEPGPELGLTQEGPPSRRTSHTAWCE